jgi:YidC/Oxa1 family membrane protein insertase
MGLWSAFVGLIESGLLFFHDIIAALGLPYSFGFAIILFTFTVKTLTYPLNVKQMKSSRAMQVLQPKMKELQKKHGDDRQALAEAQMELYREAGVNPLGGCLPVLIQMPVWFALYQALFRLADKDALQEGFFWVPSLAGPVADQMGSLNWLIPPGGENFVGWGNAIGYLVLPILLVVSQLFYQKMITPQSDDPQQRMMQQMMMFMPFMFGYFSLIVPAGLTLYWFTNNILSMVQQYFINKSDFLPKELLPDEAESTKKPEAVTEGKKQVQDNGRSNTKSRSKSKRKRKK